MNCQITHDSIHSRPGWTNSWLFEKAGKAVGFGSVAIAGPWKDKPTIFEFYVVPEQRLRAFDLFALLLATSGSRRMEVQSCDILLTVMLHTYARDVVSESIVFRDELTTALTSPGAILRPKTADKEIRKSIEQRAGGGEWTLELDGATVATGGVLFHYNVPYGDIYMEVAEPFRRRGFGSFLVQELKRIAYELGAIPAARCNPTNVASRKTLQKAGFVPYCHILDGTIPGA
jgi:RimJ/RimL family protein N-acetyltransferase